MEKSRQICSKNSKAIRAVIIFCVYYYLMLTIETWSQMHGKTSYRELRRPYHFSIKLLSAYIYEK